MTPKHWRVCTAVVVTATHVRRMLACDHITEKPLDFLNDQTRKNPHAMVGHAFPCPTCDAEARRRLLPAEQR